MFNWDIENLHLIHNEMIKQAEQDHLAQALIDANRKTQRHYNPALAWVGQRMMNVGQKLVAISGNTDDESANQSHIHLN